VPDDGVLVSVQHKDRLGDAGDAAGRQFRGEARGELAGPGVPVRSVAARQAFRLFCTLLLPLDEDSRAGARLWAELISRGCVDQPTRKLAALAYANLTDFVVRQLSDALPDANAVQAARHLVSVIEGLRWPVLFGVYTEQQAMEVIDTQLDLIF